MRPLPLVRLALAAALALLSPPANAAPAPLEPALSLANALRPEDDIDVAAYWVSEKLDGVRALWDGEALLSRRGNRLQAPPWFVAGFPALQLDGELWMGRGGFEAVSAVVRRRRGSGEGWRDVRFMVFDLPAHPGDFDERLRQLRALLGATRSPRIALVQQFRLESREELMATLSRVVAAGGEGLMLRKGNSRYRAGRSDDLLKLKRFEDAEAVVVAHLPGAGKYAQMLGALLVELPDGRRFRLGTGFSDAERRSPPAIGAVVTYKHYGHTRNGIPRFASFLRVRRPAPERDGLESAGSRSKRLGQDRETPQPGSARSLPL